MAVNQAVIQWSERNHWDIIILVARIIIAADNLNKTSNKTKGTILSEYNLS